MVTSTKRDALLDELWERFRPLVDRRVTAIESYARGLAAGLEPREERVAAVKAAHDLAGVLGTYGRHEASRIARQVEELIEAVPVPVPASADAASPSAPGAVLLELAHELRGTVQS